MGRADAYAGTVVMKIHRTGFTGLPEIVTYFRDYLIADIVTFKSGENVLVSTAGGKVTTTFYFINQNRWEVQPAAANLPSIVSKDY